MLLLLLLFSSAVALENGLARTPPMGWISWAKFFCEIDCTLHPLTCISEDLYMQAADALVAQGFKEAGYTFVNIDDCWMEMSRDGNGRLVPDHVRFSHGIKWLSKYMHERGMKLGIYQDYGSSTCGGYPGSLDHLKIDAETFASWDVDMLKLDGCNVNVTLMPTGYPQMARELNMTGRPIVYSCEWPFYTFWLDERKEGTVADYAEIARWCNLYRNYGDVAKSWDSVEGIIDYFVSQQDVFITANGPGHWNDPDMIVVGNNELNLDASEAQFGIWSMWSAPLLMSNDPRWIPDGYRDILLNKKVIAVDQDSMGIMARCISKVNGVWTFVKPMGPVRAGKYSYAVAFLNKNRKQSANISTQLQHLGLTNRNGYIVENLFKGTHFGILKPADFFKCKVNPTGICMIKATVVLTRDDGNQMITP